MRILKVKIGYRKQTLEKDSKLLNEETSFLSKQNLKENYLSQNSISMMQEKVSDFLIL